MSHLAVILVIMVIFIGDALTPKGVYLSFLYPTTTLLAIRYFKQKYIVSLYSLLCTMLVYAALILKPGEETNWKTIANRTLSVILLWIVAFFAFSLIRRKQHDAIKALAVTYNHEINNPLSIALGNIVELGEHKESQKAASRIEGALHRIAHVVRGIEKIIEKPTSHFDETPYPGGSSILKLEEQKKK